MTHYIVLCGVLDSAKNTLVEHGNMFPYAQHELVSFFGDIRDRSKELKDNAGELEALHVAHTLNIGSEIDQEEYISLFGNLDLLMRIQPHLDNLTSGIALTENFQVIKLFVQDAIEFLSDAIHALYQNPEFTDLLEECANGYRSTNFQLLHEQYGMEENVSDTDDQWSRILSY